MYNHVLKRFQVPRLNDETHSEYVERANEIACKASQLYTEEFSINTDENQLFIYSDTKGEYYDNTFIYDVDSIVVEIHEVPERVKLAGYEDLTLLLYHDTIKLENNGRIEDCENDHAQNLVQDEIIQLKAALRHLEQLQERGIE